MAHLLTINPPLERGRVLKPGGAFSFADLLVVEEVYSLAGEPPNLC
jgi:hypothetical protein